MADTHLFYFKENQWGQTRLILKTCKGIVDPIRENQWGQTRLILKTCKGIVDPIR